MPRLAAGATDATIANGSAIVNRNRSARGSEEHTITSQTDFTTMFATGSLRHEALAGVELLRERAGRWNYTTSAGSAPPTTLRNPDNDPLLPAGYGGQIRSGIVKYEGDSIGLYAQDTIEFLPGAGSSSAAHGVTSSTPTTPAAPRLTSATEPWRAGLMYQPWDTHSYYLGFSDPSNPTADLYQLTQANSRTPAERSRTLEAGAKWELFDGDLSLRAALYRAQKFYERNTDLEQANVALLSKKRHTDGIEFEAAGRITSRWEVFGGVAFMDARIDDQMPGTLLGTFADVSGGNAAGQAANASRLVYQGKYNPYTEGQRPRNAPAYTFNLWTTYKVFDNWKVGLGAEGKASAQPTASAPATRQRGTPRPA